MLDQEILVRSALAKLGPGKVMQATLAFDDPDARCTSERCFLARAYGPVGAWYRMFRGVAMASKADIASMVLGLTPEEMNAVIRAFDGNQPWFQPLVAEYLASCAEPASAPEDEEQEPDVNNEPLYDDPWDEDEFDHDEELVEALA